MNAPMTLRSYLWILALYGLPFVAALCIAPLFGSETVSWNEIVQPFRGGGWGTGTDIFFYQRIPRVILAAMVGGTLAVVGASFQVILHNPLAEPYTLGITGGASIGAASAFLFPGLVVSFWVFSTVQVFALLGCFAVLGIIYEIARRPEGFSIYALLLAGVTISIMSTGGILFIRYMAGLHLILQMDRWMMGGLDVIGYRELATLFPLLLPGLGILFTCMVELNHLTMGEELAMGHGVDVTSIQRRVFIGGGLATAAVVALSGPIGFVGLIVPHSVRQLTGYDHRIVLPASFFLGGTFLVICDTIARTLIAPTELPVGIITALVGGPLFIRILIRRG